MFDHPLFDKYRFEDIPLDRDIFLMDEVWVAEYEKSLVTVFEGGTYENVGYIDLGPWPLVVVSHQSGAVAERLKGARSFEGPVRFPAAAVHQGDAECRRRPGPIEQPLGQLRNGPRPPPGTAAEAIEPMRILLLDRASQNRRSSAASRRKGKGGLRNLALFRTAFGC